MPEGKWASRYLFFLLFVSFSTLFLIVIITFLSSRVEDGFVWRRPLTGLTFSLLCILGMIAVFFPQHCSRRPQKETLSSENSYESLQKESYLQKSTSVGGLTLTHGHHPPCDQYRQHEFILGKKTLCSACLGLFCGGLISLVGVWYVFLLQGPYDLPNGIVFALGIAGIAVSLVFYAIADSSGPAPRFCFNALMIIGMFLTLVGTDGKVQSVALNALLIVFFAFVILTRISLSQDKHGRICEACEDKCDLTI